MDATFKKKREATFKWSGRGGVVKNSWTTPPRLRELRLLRNSFLIAQPPLLLLRRGLALNSYPVLVCAHT